MLLLQKEMKYVILNLNRSKILMGDKELNIFGALYSRVLV